MTAKMFGMVNTKEDIINILEMAMKTCDTWPVQCETCEKIVNCLNAWAIDSNESSLDCLNSKQLKEYIDKFIQFMESRMKQCHEFNNN